MIEQIPLNLTVAPEDAPRLSAQHKSILDRLRRGPTTNVELNGIAFRYSARLNELKNAGFIVSKQRGNGGVFVYTLEQEP